MCPECIPIRVSVRVRPPWSPEFRSHLQLCSCMFSCVSRSQTCLVLVLVVWEAPKDWVAPSSSLSATTDLSEACHTVLLTGCVDAKVADHNT